MSSPPAIPPMPSSPVMPPTSSPLVIPPPPIVLKDFHPSSSGLCNVGDSNVCQSAINEDNTNHLSKDFELNEVVSSKEDLMVRLRVLTMKDNREFKVSYSNKSRVIVECVDKKNCEWRIRATFNKILDGWVIKRYNK